MIVLYSLSEENEKGNLSRMLAAFCPWIMLKHRKNKNMPWWFRLFFIRLGMLAALSVVFAVTHAQPRTIKFDFGNGGAAEGYVPVSAEDSYTTLRGYGFLPDASLLSVERQDRDPLTADYISSTTPFFFAVDLPEGNYDVRVWLGDAGGTSSQTIRIENRRLMVETFSTQQGEVVTKDFTAHIRTPLIAGSSQQVRLKPRELDYAHWDHRLTLEFNGDAPKLVALEIVPNTDAVTVFLAGNSTVVDQAEEPYAAWGQLFPVFFQAGKAAIANYAESGETLRTFRGARRLEKILSLMKTGDYLFIEFAHNDQKPGGNFLDPFTTYKETLAEYVAAVREKGGFPVLVTSMHRRNFDEAGNIINTLGDYPEAVRQTGRELGVPVIDLHAMSKVLYEAWGVDESLKAFVHYPAHTFAGQDKPLADNTHFSPYGAYQLARCVVEGVRQQVPVLAGMLKTDIPDYDPAHPDSHAGWYWPLSPKVSVVKPDGH